MQLDGAGEAEAERLLDGDVEEAELLQLLGPSSPAISTSSCCPLTSPATRVGAKVVLNALTTGVPSGTSRWSSSAEEVPGGVARLSQVWVSSGLAMSTTTLPASWSAYSWAASLLPG